MGSRRKSHKAITTRSKETIKKKHGEKNKWYKEKKKELDDMMQLRNRNEDK